MSLKEENFGYNNYPFKPILPLRVERKESRQLFGDPRESPQTQSHSQDAVITVLLVQ